MTLDVKRGRGRPKKLPDIKPDIDRVIDIWFSQEPEEKQGTITDIHEVSRIPLIWALTIFVCVATLYLVVRI